MNKDMLRAHFKTLRQQIAEQQQQIESLEGDIRDLQNQNYSDSYYAQQQLERYSREASRLHSDVTARRLELERLERKTRQEAADRDWDRMLGRI